MAYSREALQFEPGSRWSYSNPGINTLGRLVEVLSGKDFATFIQERIDNVVTAVDTAAGETWDEPETEYNSKYPWNNVVETESGHIFEMDDTYESERIHLAHRNGSFQEWFPLGDKVEKITKDRYTIVMGNDKIYIMGDVDITVQGNAGIYVQKNATVLVDGDVDATVHGSVTAQVDGDVTATVDGSVIATIGGDMTADIAGDCTETVGGAMSTDVGGDYNITAANFIVQAGKISLN
jgi:CubicO group peptidase (beta-lactamase class C family)